MLTFSIFIGTFIALVLAYAFAQSLYRSLVEMDKRRFGVGPYRGAGRYMGTDRHGFTAIAH